MLWECSGGQRQLARSERMEGLRVVLLHIPEPGVPLHMKENVYEVVDWAIFMIRRCYFEELWDAPVQVKASAGRADK